jgi:hypothetical protein
MGDIINLVEILEEQEKQKKLQEEYEKEELRAHLRWVLDKIHEKNITYDKADEFEDDTSLSGGWFSKLFRRKKDDPEP